MILKDKIIVVTGGNGLIGKQIINEIFIEGGKAINLDITNSIKPSNDNYFFDITSRDIKDNLNDILKNYSKIDGLVNNAYPRTSDWGNSLENVSLDSFSKNVDWQLNSVFEITKHIANLMKEKSSGSVVSIGSIYGIVGNDFSIYDGTSKTSPVAYSAIKGGIISMNRYFASYFGSKKIRFNCVSPGGVFDNQDEKFIKKYSKKVPLKRMCNPEDISGIIAFLLSDKSQYITGQNIAVDGGWTII